jgi:hypothetical protein
MYVGRFSFLSIKQLPHPVALLQIPDFTSPTWPEIMLSPAIFAIVA